MVKISAVMAVYNGAPALPRTIDSILAQTEKNFELVVVDDGSTDETSAILADYAARDPRVRVIAQANAGLTRSLIRGCAEARASVIARQDCGDHSMPQRFERQLTLMAEGHVLVSCATRFVDPEGDTLYTVSLDGDETRRSLLNADAKHIHGITSHPSAMFHRDAYVAAGGYRPEFRMAQDLDLWIRMARLGTIGIAPDVLVEVTVEPRGLSGVSRDTQTALTQIAVALRDGGDEQTLLAAASTIRPSPITPRAEAAGLYFIGKCLLQRRNPRGLDYLRRAVARDPLHVRAWLSLLVNRLRRGQ